MYSRLKTISNRKLYRLGVSAALLMTGCLVYLIYSDATDTGIDDVNLKNRLIGYTKPSGIYFQRELGSQLYPVDERLLTQRKSRFKSAFNRQNGYSLLISTDSDIWKSKKSFGMEDNNVITNEKEDGDLNSKTDNLEQPKQHNAFSSNHSNNFIPQKQSSYLNSKPGGKRLNNGSLRRNTFKNANSKYDNMKLNSFKSQKLSLNQDEAKSDLNHNRIISLDGSYNSFTKGQGHIKKSINKSSNTGINGSNRKKKKYLIYLCESAGWCGGWGDRQRGIASSYHLSKIFGREFKIVMDTPCNLTKFYRPNKVNWILKQDEIKHSTSRIVLNTISKLHFKDQLKVGDFNARYPHDIIFLKTNQDFISPVALNPIYFDKVKQHKDLFYKQSRFRCAMSDLMQPSEFILLQLQELVGAERLIRKGLISKPLENLHYANNNNWSNIRSLIPKNSSSSISMHLQKGSSFSSSSPKPLICAHVRMGKNPTIPMDEEFDSVTPRDIPKLLSFLQSKDTNHDAEFFLATDFEGIRKKFVQFFGKRLIHYDGKIIHIDRQRDTVDACIGFGVALLDQLVLSVCDQLVISRSGFSIHASYMSNSTRPVYIMEDGTIKVFNRLDTGIRYFR